jgi:hypothetical protein
MSYSMKELMADQPSQPQAQPAVGAPTPSAVTSPTGTYSMSDLMKDDNSNTSGSTAPHVGPNRQPNPNNVYRATDEESTPEGAAAAIARRQNEHPILSGIGQGAESLLQPVFHPIDTVESLVKQSLPPFQVYDSMKRAYPLIQAYEKARWQGNSVWQSISATNDYAKKQEDASQLVEKAIADYKKNPTQMTAKVLTQVAGTVAMLAAGGAGATAESDVPLVTRAADTAAAATPETEPGIIQQIVKGRAVNQQGTQAAVRQGVQQSVKTTNIAEATARNEAEAAQSAPVEKYPVSVEHDTEGNVISADGRHRVVEAWEKGDKFIPVTTKLADGSTEVINQTPEAAAKKMGLGNNLDEAKASLEQSDATQPYRAPNGKPRTPVYEKPQSKASSDMTPVKLPEESTPLTQNQKATIVDDHLDALEQQKAAAYKRIDDAAGFDVKALKDKLKTDQYNLTQLGSSDPDKAGRLVEAINESTDRITEANAKMKTAGIDPDSADALNTRWKAGQDFKKSLLNSVDTDGNYDPAKLWKSAKTLRSTKYGDRLEQFFGSKEAADGYVSKLAEAERLGTHAVKARWVAGILSSVGLAGVGLGKASSLVHVAAAALP